MATKKIIVTADDYGVVPSIDKAITNAVVERKINSVAAFANYGEAGAKSVENAKKLIDEAGQNNAPLELGVHLTISSGNPILGKDKVPSLYEEGTNHFRSHLDLSLNDTDLVEMKNELQAQIDVFKKAEIPIHHLTCHHNTFNVYKDFFLIYLDIAKENNLPVRSPRVRPRISNDFYVGFYLHLNLLEDITPVEVMKIHVFLKTIRIAFRRYGKVRAPDYMDIRHYGPIPGREFPARKEEHLLKKKLKTMKKIFSKFKRSDDKLMEIVIHMRDGEITNHEDYKKETDATGYFGIDPQYFDSRVLEYKSVLKTDFEQLLAKNDMQWGSWKDAKTP